MFRDTEWRADVERVEGRGRVFKEQSLWAIWVYRFGRREDRRAGRVRRVVCNRIYWIAFRLVETVTGISLPKNCEIGPGLRIWHFGGVFVHPSVKIGANCTLRQGVTIGNRAEKSGVPSIGDDVEIGAYAQILGPVIIGDGAKIGAMAVVISNVPPGCTAVGNPARVLLPKEAVVD